MGGCREVRPVAARLTSLCYAEPPWKRESAKHVRPAMTSGVCRRLPQPAPWDLPFTSGLMALVQATGYLRGHRMRRTLVTAIALALAGVTSPILAAQTPHAAPVVEATTQLPRNVRPMHYDVAVVPHAESLTFDGHVAITLDVLDADGVHHPQRGRHDLRQRVAGGLRGRTARFR